MIGGCAVVVLGMATGFEDSVFPKKCEGIPAGVIGGFA